jgi:hypothetical protein
VIHIEFFLEEESCAEALKLLAPKIIGNLATFDMHVFQGKSDLLTSLPQRLHGYARWLPADRRIVVLVDRDNDDCLRLKENLEDIARNARLVTRSSCKNKGQFHVLNRIAIEELEAWFFGDVEALATAYPRVPRTLAQKRGFRDSDAIAGGTWEALERVLRNAGYYSTGMPKIEVARNVSVHMVPDRNRSGSFRAFRDALRQMMS